MPLSEVQMIIDPLGNPEAYLDILTAKAKLVAVRASIVGETEGDTPHEVMLGKVAELQRLHVRLSFILGLLPKSRKILFSSQNIKLN